MIQYFPLKEQVWKRSPDRKGPAAAKGELWKNDQGVHCYLLRAEAGLKFP